MRCFVAILLDLGDEGRKTKNASTEDIKSQVNPSIFRHSVEALSDFNVVVSRLQSSNHQDSGEWLLPVDVKVLYTSKAKEEAGSKETLSGSSVSLCYVLDSHITSAKKDNIRNKSQSREAHFQGLLSGWRSAVSSVVKRM